MFKCFAIVVAVVIVAVVIIVAGVVVVVGVACSSVSFLMHKLLSCHCRLCTQTTATGFFIQETHCSIAKHYGCQ